MSIPPHPGFFSLNIEGRCPRKYVAVQMNSRTTTRKERKFKMADCAPVALVSTPAADTWVDAVVRRHGVAATVRRSLLRAESGAVRRSKRMLAWRQ